MSSIEESRRMRISKFQADTEQFGVLRLTMAVAAFIAGAGFCWADEKWHSQSSFYYINKLPIPWAIYGALLVVAAICLMISRIRPIGYLIGGIVYTIFSFGAWLAVLGGLHWHIIVVSYLAFPDNTVGSFFAACNLATIAVLYWSALRYSIIAQVDPERVGKVRK